MTGEIEKLREIVLNDADLQAHLQGISQREEFIARVLETAESFGLEIGSEDISEAMRETRRLWIERWI